ncbi:MAG: DUF2202 domain-containing protein [Candidatus Latescibacterota bacterium]
MRQYLSRRRFSFAGTAALSFIKEEEKLARDVNQGIFNLWGTTLSGNIIEDLEKEMPATDKAGAFIPDAEQ